MTIKVVYNCCYGGFSLSDEAINWLASNGIGSTDYLDLPRHDSLLVKCVESLGDRASGSVAKLRIHTLKGNKYKIEDYDGLESVVEPEDCKWIVVETGL